jgi:hypothetical protein
LLDHSSENAIETGNVNNKRLFQKMEEKPLSSSLRSILSVLEDETTANITNWRLFCFMQLTRLRFSEFQHFQVGLQFQRTSKRLTEELNRISAELKVTQSGLRAALGAAPDLENLIPAKFQGTGDSRSRRRLCLWRRG